MVVSLFLHTHNEHTLSLYFVPPRPPRPLPLSFPSPALHAASPTVGNVNGLSLLGVVAPSLASQANLRQPLRRGGGGGGESMAVCRGKERDDVKG